MIVQGDDEGPSGPGRSGISQHCTYESLKRPGPTAGGGPEDDAESGKRGVTADWDRGVAIRYTVN